MADASESSTGRDEEGATGNGEKAEDIEDPPEAHEESRPRKPRVGRVPITPTKADLEEHLPLHLEYREWCPHCVAGKSTGEQHRSRQEEEALGSTVSVDYAFMVPEEQEQDMCPILVAYDHSKYGLWVMETDHKGATDASVKFMSMRMEEAGHIGNDITMKSDQEDAVVALKRAVAGHRQGKTAMIESPVRESQKNGKVERSIKTWQAQFRTMRHYLEARIGHKVPQESPVLSWLSTFAADTMNRYKIQRSGRTNFEMSTGHRCRQIVCGFGEKVMCRCNPDKSRRNKMTIEWDTGYFVGIVCRTSEYIIANEGGLFTCSNIKRHPDESAYDKDILDIVKLKYR